MAAEYWNGQCVGCGTNLHVSVSADELRSFQQFIRAELRAALLRYRPPRGAIEYGLYARVPQCQVPTWSGNYLPYSSR